MSVCGPVVWTTSPSTVPNLMNQRKGSSGNQLCIMADASKKKQQSQQPRQLLSCTKCRERKVKCDRTKPCLACCARGAPKDCHFIAEGGDYAPIQQSYELKRLRAENLRLKERLRARKTALDDDEPDLIASPESQHGEGPSSSQRRRTANQKRFQGPEWQDSLYFGSPGLASVMKDFAFINNNPGSASASLVHLMPRGQEMYATQNPPTYPFPTMFPANPLQCIPALLSCLPSKEELFQNLDSFEKRVNICSFPHVPFEVTRSEVERFLTDPRKNSQMCPDMLALLFAAIALGSQYSVWDKSGQQWNADVMSSETRKGEVYIAAAMQGLRLASFMQKPSLLGIQTLIMIGPWLTNSGRFLDAWTLFGTTIRLAQSIGLHRHPKYLDPAPPSQGECSVRQALWWWMLHMDEQYSMTLGRPLGISGIGDCLWPQELTTDPAKLRFGEFVHHFTILARQILSSDRLTHVKIDEYTDALRALLETMPETLQFNESWGYQETEIPEYPLSAMSAVYYCKAHTYLILLNRQRVDKHSTHPQMSNARNFTSSLRSADRPPSTEPSTPTSGKGSLRGRPLVLSSSEDILGAFLFFYRRAPAALIDWTIAQQAFNSCMILLLDAIENRRITDGAMKAEMAYAVFKELDDNNVHKLAGLAIERISWALQELRKAVEKAAENVRQPGVDTDKNVVSQSELPSGSRPTDTVMGSTGLMLLEDSGLQGFVQEEWSPITWAMSRTHTNVGEEQEAQFSNRDEQLGGIKPEQRNDSFASFRSVDMIQEMHRVLPSAPTGYTTPSEDDQSRNDTDPMSHTNLTMSQHHSLDAAVRQHCEQQTLQDQHQFGLREFNHTQLGGSMPISVADSTSYNGWEYGSVPPRKAQMQDGSCLMPPTPHQQVPFVQLRSNSCPMIPKLASEPPSRRSPLGSSNSNSNIGKQSAPQTRRTSPLQSSFSVPTEAAQKSSQAYVEPLPAPISRFDNTEIPYSFEAGTAPLSSIAGSSAMSFSQPAFTDQMPMFAPGFTQSMTQGQTQQMVYPFSFHFPHTPSYMGPFTETINLDM